MDSVDAALVELRFSESRPSIRLLDFRRHRMPQNLRERVLTICDADRGRTDEICQLNVEIGELFARAAQSIMRANSLEPGDVDVIGSHGQTVYHIPCRDRRRGWRTRSTLQLGDPCVIAERTGVTVVADFRTRDMAAGGEGAPLVPLVDYLLFGSVHESRIVQNIGGIANATLLPASHEKKEIIAFDTGPGNMVMDALVEHFTNGQERMDRGGKRAMRGKIDHAWLAELLRHPYFRRRPPKSTGRETFGRGYALHLVREGTQRGASEDDIIATATALTVESIAQAYERFLFPRCDVHRVIVSGGGSRNVAVRTGLRERLPGVAIGISDEWGVPWNAKEALAFAVLGAFTLLGRPGNVPSVTGARHEVILGVIAPAATSLP